MDLLYNKLFEYSKTNAYPFHMPGHKRNTQGDLLNEISKIDITEIDGFDNLHDACGILLEVQEKAAHLYNAEESFCLVNGSTCGILSAISTCVPNNGWLMMARNCHKAVYHAVMLGNLKTVYLYPGIVEDFSFNTGITKNQIEHELKNFEKMHPSERISAVIITSPTYEGVISDVKEIVDFLHKKNIPLIVDEAHGAHLGIVDETGKNSCQLGADIVIHSLHKTLPAMTQTALLHVNGELVDRKRLKRYLSVYQTSSPSYVLMASIDRAVTMMQKNGKQYFQEFFRRRGNMLRQLSQCRMLRIFEDKGADVCKLIVSTRGTNISGKDLYDILRMKYDLQLEMAAPDYVVAILTVMDKAEGFSRLTKALLEIDGGLKKNITNEIAKELPRAVLAYTIGEALELPSEFTSLERAAGRVCSSFVYVYPPGIPILAPGEVITGQHIDYLKDVRKQGLDLKGLENDCLSVLQKSENC